MYWSTLGGAINSFEHDLIHLCLNIALQLYYEREIQISKTDPIQDVRFQVVLGIDQSTQRPCITEHKPNKFYDFNPLPNTHELLIQHDFG
jgi:hypothetical protein